MSSLVEKEQTISVVPQDFRNANKGKVVDISDDGFSVEVFYNPKGLLIKNLTEFYSQTKNGVLYFQSDILNIDGNILKIANPIKHRFLQRRKFTRIKFTQNVTLQVDTTIHNASTIDLSAGGMKLQSKDNINLELEYRTSIPLSNDQTVECTFQPIRIEKRDDGLYTLSGRFKNLSNVDKMTLVQFCMKKSMENVNK